jgi:hypothetical protein
MFCARKNHKAQMQNKYQPLQICKWNLCSMLLRVMGTLSYWMTGTYMHWFCSDDLSHYVHAITWKYAIIRPSIPIVWPIQEDIDLIQKEVTTLKEMGFPYNYSHVQSLFASQSSNSNISHVLVMNVHNIVRSTNASCWPTTHGDKKVKQRPIFKIT